MVRGLRLEYNLSPKKCYRHTHRHASSNLPFRFIQCSCRLSFSYILKLQEQSCLKLDEDYQSGKQTICNPFRLLQDILPIKLEENCQSWKTLLDDTIIILSREGAKQSFWRSQWQLLWHIWFYKPNNLNTRAIWYQIRERLPKLKTIHCTIG